MKTPVLIAAWNEADEIERTLDALPRSAEPIVIPNRCEDDTAAIARSCGAVVLQTEANGKMPALQEGIKHLGERAKEPFIVLDADARPFRGDQWLRSILSERRKLDAEKPAVVVGTWLYHDIGPVDGALRFASMLRNHTENHRDPVRGGFCGRNMLFHPQTQESVDGLLDLPNYWPREDVAMKDVLVREGGNTLKSVNLLTSVVTSGHRYGPILQRIIKGKDESIEQIQQSYVAEGPDDARRYIGNPVLAEAQIY